MLNVGLCGECSTAGRHGFGAIEIYNNVEDRLKCLGGLAGLEGMRAGQACPPAGIYSSAIACGMVSTVLGGEDNFDMLFKMCRSTSLSVGMVRERREGEPANGQVSGRGLQQSGRASAALGYRDHCILAIACMEDFAHR